MGSRRARRGDRGAAAVELALVVTPLLYILFGTIAYGYMFSFRQALSQAAAEAARASVGAQVGTACAQTGPFSSACPAQFAASTAVSRALAGYGMACGENHLVCAIPAPSASGCGTANTCITVTLDYPYRQHSLLPSLPGYSFVLPEQLSFSSAVQVS
ncbi:TadE family protein [Nocardioides marmotae]|nr:pilus assembly protein [Nocardioides marmotae]